MRVSQTACQLLELAEAPINFKFGGVVRILFLLLQLLLTMIIVVKRGGVGVDETCHDPIDGVSGRGRLVSEGDLGVIWPGFGAI